MNNHSESMPTGSPIPSSRTRSMLNTSNMLIKTTRRSPQTKIVGNFCYRVINQRPILNSPKKIPDEISKKLGIIAVNGIPIGAEGKSKSSITQENSNAANSDNDNGNDDVSDNDDGNADVFDNIKYDNMNENTELVIDLQSNSQNNSSNSESEDMIELEDYNKFTPRQNKHGSYKGAMHASTPDVSHNNIIGVGFESQVPYPAIETIGSKANNQSIILGRIVKKAAVSSLGKLSGQPQTRIFCSKVYANFFKSFDEWNRQLIKKEEKKQLENQKDNSTNQSILSAQLQLAKEKIESLSREEELWKNESRNSQSNKSQNSSMIDNSEPLKIDVDYNYDLSKELILQVDPVLLKIQSDDSIVKSINTMADDIAVKLNEISNSNTSSNIDQLLGH